MRALGAISDARVAKALSHPLRIRILGILEERRASPRELAAELEAPLQNVSYHVRALAAMKLVKLVKMAPRRGAVEHYYEAVVGAVRVPDDTWGKMPTIARQAVGASILNGAGKEASDSLASGGFDSSDAHVSRTALVLDREGFSALAKELKRLLERADRLQRDSAARLKQADHPEPVQTGLVMLLYEKLSVPATPPVDAKTRRGSRRPQKAAR